MLIRKSEYIETNILEFTFACHWNVQVKLNCNYSPTTITGQYIQNHGHHNVSEFYQVQLREINVLPLVNKSYVNKVTLTEQSLCQKSP